MTRAAFLCALLALLPGRAAAQGVAAGAPPLPPAGATWTAPWSALDRAAGLARASPVLPRFPDVLTAPAHRTGVFWTAGAAAGLPFEVEDERADFRAARAATEGAFRRPLDPGGTGLTRLDAVAWRPLGDAAAVAGGVDVGRERLEPSSVATILEPYAAGPHVPTDTTAPALDRTRVRLEGGGGRRFGSWSVGAALGYDVIENRSGRARSTRTGRGTVGAASAGIARAFGERGPRVAVYGALRTRAESISLSTSGGPGLLFELQGYAEPEPRQLRSYNRRLEGHGSAYGAAAAGRLAGVDWALFGERREWEEAHSSLFENDPPAERWTAEGHAAGLSLQRALDARTLVAVRAARESYTGFASRHDLTGIIFRAEESALDARAELRREVEPGAWGGGVAVQARRESRFRRDAVDLISSDVQAWTAGAALEAGRALGERLAVSAAYAASFYSPDARVPDPASRGEAYRRLIAPELAFYASDARAHGAALTLRWTAAGGTRLWTRASWGALSPAAGAGGAPAFAPGGRRTAWALTVGATM